MPVITITSDWNQNDYYLGAVKGQIIRLAPNAGIIDLNHSISPHNSHQAAFILAGAYPHFPEHSIHLNFVDAEPGSGQKILAVKANKHYFIGNDNGSFEIILNTQKAEIVQLELLEKPGFTSFPGLFTLTRAAANLFNGKNLSELGTVVKNWQSITHSQPAYDQNTLTGTVMYNDSYGNAMTNIDQTLFEEVAQGRKFNIFVQRKHYMIDQIQRHYNTVKPGDLLAIFNSLGRLEIAIREGNARKLLNLGFNATVRIQFTD